MYSRGITPPKDDPKGDPKGEALTYLPMHVSNRDFIMHIF